MNELDQIIEIDYSIFLSDNAINNRLINYNLNDKSIIFEIGGYLGDWVSKINEKYKSNIYVFEPIIQFYNELKNRFANNKNIRCFNYGLGSDTYKTNINKTDDKSSLFNDFGVKEEVQIININDVIKNLNINNIDLMQMNIEGFEYPLLEYIISSNLIEKINILQIQFHRNINHCIEIRNNLINNLKKTHRRLFNYEFIFESWMKK